MRAQDRAILASGASNQILREQLPIKKGRHLESAPLIGDSSTSREGGPGPASPNAYAVFFGRVFLDNAVEPSSPDRS
jgi:hypothetical protein